MEKTLALLQGEHADEKIELVQVAESGETPTLELRLLRNAAQLGWRVHKRIRLAPGQIPDLQAGLNMMDIDARSADNSGPRLELVV